MWERLDETMGQPKSYLLQDDGDWSRLKRPDLNVPNRLRDVRVHSTLCRPFSHGIAGIERLYDDAVSARL